MPPENSPRITLTRILTRVQGAPSRFIAWRCRKYTPMSDGMESNPQQCTMRAQSPDAAFVTGTALKVDGGFCA